jgi:hypothetical protein
MIASFHIPSSDLCSWSTAAPWVSGLVQGSETGDRLFQFYFLRFVSYFIKVNVAAGMFMYETGERNSTKFGIGVYTKSSRI